MFTRCHGNLGDAPWNCFKASLNDQDNPNAPSWQKAEYDIWYRDPKVVMRNMLSNPDFAREFDTTPYVELKDGKRRRSDFMSANFAWRQCVSASLSFFYAAPDPDCFCYTGHSSQRKSWTERWCNVCANYSWKWQNDGYSCYGWYWISSFVSFNRQYTQPSTTSTSQWCCSHWISCYTEEWVSYSSVIIEQFTDVNWRWTKTRQWCQFPKVQTPALSLHHFSHSPAPQACDVLSRSLSLSRWTLSACPFWDWAIYSRLPRAGYVGRD